ncbi:MAG: PspC domain-containing protein [Bacteroidales bacterium]|nr:PspC domain-containing protein [Bacteroidales bacterium]
MKNTENISLGGYAFTIETDAYIDLEKYINEIRSCFSSDPSAEEIIADIEERIAELLKEQTVSGVVVSLPMIQEIKRRIGNPEELAQDEQTEEGRSAQESQQYGQRKTEKKGWKTKPLYRDIDSRVFGGVCSGLGAYFGIDNVIIRLIFIVLFIGGLFGLEEGPYIFISIIAYICLWIAMPAARTGEQKREMLGRPTDLKDYKGKDFDFDKEMKEVTQSPGGRTIRRIFAVFFGIFFLIIGLGGLLGGIFIPSVPEIINNEMADHIMRWGALDAEEQFVADIFGGTTFWGLVLVMLGIGSIGIIYGAVMLLFDLKSPAWRPGLILFIAWIISIFVIIGWMAVQVADALPELISL